MSFQRHLVATGPDRPALAPDHRGKFPAMFTVFLGALPAGTVVPGLHERGKRVRLSDNGRRTRMHIRRWIRLLWPARAEARR